MFALALLAAAVPLLAQAPQPPAAVKPDSAPASVAPVEPKLVFEREVYSYPGAAGRRDPFRPLTGRDDAGPVFQDLKLKVILYIQGNPARSVASIEDGNRKIYRVRRGDVIGNATVVDIGPQRVLFSVEDFGIRRQEVLQLKPTNREGA